SNAAGERDSDRPPHRCQVPYRAEHPALEPAQGLLTNPRLESDIRPARKKPMKPHLYSFTQKLGFSVLFLLAGLRMASADPTIVSTVPANLAAGVSPTAAVVFTFSEPMDTANTEALFLVPPFTTLTTTAAWSANDTVLTCTPTPAFPANTNIIW